VVRLVHLVLFIAINFLTGVSTFGGEFPTDRGSFRLNCGTLFLLSENNNNPPEHRISDLTISVDYILTTDISLGLWYYWDDIFVGRTTESNIGLGPQFTWFIGGHTRKPRLNGAILPHIGMAYLFGLKKLRVPSCTIILDGYNQPKYDQRDIVRFFFGISVMPTDRFGLYFEWAARIYGGCRMGSKFGINLGLTSFIY
jgi:hypothetical protein